MEIYIFVQKETGLILPEYRLHRGTVNKALFVSKAVAQHALDTYVKRDDIEIKQIGYMIEDENMLKLTIKIEGQTFRDLDEAVGEVSKKLKREFLSGSDSNEDGSSYHFEVTGEEGVYYTLLVSNIGWVITETDHITDKEVMDGLFKLYVDLGSDQVTLWRSDEIDPIREYDKESK